MMRIGLLASVVALGIAAQSGCAGKGGGSVKSGGLTVISSAFVEGETIPTRYTCSGENVSPPLSWSGGSDKVKAYALLCADPDAPTVTFNHWVLYDLPATTTSLPEGVSDAPELEGGAKQGLNNFEQIGYGGPCPPPGKPHRYIFRVIALDAPTGLEPGVRVGPLLAAIRGHVLQEGRLTGTFGR